MPTIAPSITIQMNRKRAISSVQIQCGIHAVKRAMICSVTGTTRIADRRGQEPVEQAVVAVDELAHIRVRASVVRAKKDRRKRALPPDPWSLATSR